MGMRRAFYLSLMKPAHPFVCLDVHSLVCVSGGFFCSAINC